MDLIKTYIPETFYAEPPDEERLKMLIKHWQRAIKVNQELEEKISKSAGNAGYVEPAETETLIKIINMLDKQISNAEWEMEILLVSEKPEELNYVKGKRQAYYITKRYIEKYCGKNSILSPEER